MDLNRAAQAGELDDEDIQAIQNMLRSNKGLKTNEMSLGDDFELGLGAVPHTRIKNPVDYNDVEDDDYDVSLSDDDEDPELNDPFAWQYEDDEDDVRRDRNHEENDGHYFFQDDDDF
jgi:hypothetical protein